MRFGGRRASRRTTGLTPQQRATVWQCASLLMDHPGATQPLGAVRDALAGLPDRVAVPLASFLDHCERTDLLDRQAEYAATFDTRRRCNLFLTYFAHGDTRKRGMALLRFKQAYQSAGVTLDDGELPDHLCVVLEFAATVDAEIGGALLNDHRAGLEMLRIALRDHESPWAPVMEAVSATLPELRGDEAEAVQRLAAEGPPAEEVGLTPYGVPAFDPGLAAASGPVDLPMPTTRPLVETKGA